MYKLCKHSQTKRKHIYFQDIYNGPLGQLLSQFQADQEFQEFKENENHPQTAQPLRDVQQTSRLSVPQGPAYGFIPMPVDYETYCNWMKQFGEQGMMAPGQGI